MGFGGGEYSAAAAASFLVTLINKLAYIQNCCKVTLTGSRLISRETLLILPGHIRMLNSVSFIRLTVLCGGTDRIMPGVL